MIDTSHPRGFGIILRSNVAVPPDKSFPRFKSSEILAISPPSGWGCAQVVRNDAFRIKGTKIVSLVPIDTDEIPQIVNDWVELLNEAMKEEFFTILNVIPAEVLEPFAEEGEWRYTSPFWVPIVFEIPHERRWTPHMNLAMFSLIRYLYRSEYASIPERTLQFKKEYPALTTLQAIFLATYPVKDDISSTFSIHAPSFDSYLPVATFQQALSNIKSSVFTTFNVDTDIIFPPTITNNMVALVSRGFLSEIFPSVSRNLLAAMLRSVERLKLADPNPTKDVLRSENVKKVAELIKHFNEKKINWISPDPE